MPWGHCAIAPVERTSASVFSLADRTRLSANHECLCVFLIKILRYLQTGIVIAALSWSHHCDVLVRLGYFGRGSADCPFPGQRTWDAPSNRWPLLSDKPYGADSELPCRQSF